MWRQPRAAVPAADQTPDHLPAHLPGLIQQAGRFYTGRYYAADAGRTWTATGPQRVTSIAVAPDRAVYLGAHHCPVHVSTDGGETWTARTSPQGYQGGLAACERGPLYSAVPEQLLCRSRDGGATWDSTSLQYTALCITQTPGGALLADTPDGPVYRSTDNGGHWSAARPPEVSPVRAIVASGNYLLAGGGALWVSANDGRDWAPVKVPAQILCLAADSHGRTCAGTANGVRIAVLQ
ncbi:MAG: sialidase family protein [Candidatus Latescibacterota bacterium]